MIFYIIISGLLTSSGIRGNTALISLNLVTGYVHTSSARSLPSGPSNVPGPVKRRDEAKFYCF